MVVNSSSLVEWRVYTYPYGMNVTSQGDLEERILSKAKKTGIPCFISYEGVSLDSLSALIGLKGTDCMMISRREKSSKKGLLRSAAKQAFSSVRDNFILMFGGEGTSSSMYVYKSNSNGALLDLLEGTEGCEPTNDHWTRVMEIIIDEVAKECRK